ncbi:MAG TPA: sugar-binding protein, partial [Ferruginibacter sp.]|nr:sugar-binding protein [Ferruginibacter sp.]
MENIYKSITSYSKSIPYKKFLLTFVAATSSIKKKLSIANLAFLIFLLVGSFSWNNAVAQFTDVTINAVATAGGSWSGGTAGPYVFTPSGAGATANINTTDIINRLAGTGGFTAGNVTILTTTGTSANGDITVSTAFTAANPSSTTASTLTLTANRNIAINAAINLTGATGASTLPGALGDNITLTAGANGTVITAATASITTNGGQGGAPSGGTSAGAAGAAGSINIVGPKGITLASGLFAIGGAGQPGSPGNGASASGAGGAGGNISLSSTSGAVSINPFLFIESLGGAGGGGSNGFGGNGGMAGTIGITASGNISLGASGGIAANGGNGGSATQTPTPGIGGAGNTVTINSTGGTVTLSSGVFSEGGNGASPNNGNSGSQGGVGGNVTVTGSGNIGIAGINTSAGTPGANNGQAPGVNGVNSGNISISTGGSVTITAALNTTGGAGSGATSTSASGNGGNAGSVTITGPSGISITTGAITANGGTVTNATGNNANGGNGGIGGTITLTSSAGPLSSTQSISAAGGAGGAATGGTANGGNGGSSGAISLTGSTGITISSTVVATGGTGGAKAGGGTIGSNGTGNDITISDGNTIVGGANTGISGVISGRNLITGGAGTINISQAETYTGTTTVNSGTLQLGATNAIPSTSNVTLAGGTLSSGNTTGFSDQMGTLTISSNSTIKLGTGSHALKFTSISGAYTGLTITGWAGAAGASGTAGQVFIGTTSAGLSGAQLAVTAFTTYAGGASILATGEVVPTSLVNTTAATSITTTGATLNGTFNTGGTAAAESFTIGTVTDVGVGTPATIHSGFSSVTARPDSALITALTPNTLYTYKAISGATSGADVTFITLPNPPTIGSASTISSTGFTANWTAPTGEGAAAITYTVEVSTDPTFSSGVTTITGIAGTSTVISGLNTATTYYYKVETVNATGPSTWSAVSSPVTSNVSNSVSCNTGSGAVGNGGTIASSTVLPTIDGLVDPVWSTIPANSISNVVVGSSTGNTQTWKSLWTPDSLYFLVQVNDPTLISQAPTANLGAGTGGNAGGLACTAAVGGASQSTQNEYYGSDGVEITLDGNYSHTAGYNGYSDVQFRFNLGGCSVSGESGGTATNYNGAEFLAVYPKVDYKVIKTSTGYNVEAAIPWGTSAANPGINDSTATNVYGAVYAGKNIGLDIQVNDATGVGSRT